MTLTNYLRLLSKFKNGWIPTSTRNIWFSLDSSARSLHSHRETSDEGPQRNVFRCKFENVASTILQTDKQQREQSHAFYMILRHSNSEQNLKVSTPQIHFRNRINRSCRRQPGKLRQFSDRMCGRKLIHFPKKTEISFFSSAFRAVLGPTELSSQATEWRLVTL